MKHQARNPFPHKTKDGYVVDEKCRCGKLRSEHSDSFGLAFGHGSAEGCEKYTWASNVFEKKRPAPVPSRVLRGERNMKLRQQRD